MRIAVLGTGAVGRTLAGALAAQGDDVTLGTRDPEATRGDAASDVPGFLDTHPDVALATFADAADGAELTVLAVGGRHALEVVAEARAGLAGKVLLDLTNPLDFSGGFPPTLTVCNTTSLGEQVQDAAPDARVVKALNTVNVDVMVEPAAVGDGAHDLFICGNDADAKQAIATLLRERFGWQSMIDLGDISASRGTEMYLALWTRTMAALGTARFNIHVVR